MVPMLCLELLLFCLASDTDCSSGVVKRVLSSNDAVSETGRIISTFNEWDRCQDLYTQPTTEKLVKNERGEIATSIRVP
ncbi:hypothetical protein GcC1_c3699o24 [Golovinomyces cichoracearum]|uniref:Uncharacterized protein n=1 Tax=Golovinomyces cichoracearum TaxID=62708 RepID=A0A420HQZ8_9PEZI|nr:hypothetical protein GcC1_c3699o24 [Golovinomyces cichoracearum]